MDTTSSTSPTAGRPPQVTSSLLSRRLGNAARDLELPLCAICSIQTSYTGDDLDLSSEDSTYRCRICLDPRQYIGMQGQTWTTLPKLLGDTAKQYRNEFKELVPNLVWTLRTQPSVGIGQRAFLIKDPELEDALVMWDCIAYIDDRTLQSIDELSNGKGLAHIIISHPHYFSTTSIWAAAFPKSTIWLAKADFHEWYQRRDVVEAFDSLPGNEMGFSSASPTARQIRLVDEEQTKLDPASSFTILILGGHFPGSLVLLWRDMLFVADTIQIVPSGRYKSHEKQRQGVTSVSFLWSYPNLIPLSGSEITRLCKPLQKVEFKTAFGAFECVCFLCGSPFLADNIP